MNLLHELNNKFGDEYVLVNRLDGILKISDTDVLTVIDFVRPYYDDIIDMIVEEEDFVVLHCDPFCEFKN